VALTLTEGNKYSRTELQREFIDRLVKADKVMSVIPFKTVLGNSLTYNTFTTRSTANWYDVGDTITESTPVMAQATAVLRQLMHDMDINEFIKRTRSNIADVRSEVLNEGVTVMKETFMDAFIYGDNSSNAKQPSGLQKLITSTTYNTAHAGVTGSGTGTALSMARLDVALDLIPDDGAPSRYMLMSKKMRTLIGTYLTSIGSSFPRVPSAWGVPLDSYRNIPILTSDFILNTETAASDAYTAKTGGSSTSIFVVTFGDTDVCGIQGTNNIELEPIGQLETKDAERVRAKWYVSLMMQNLRTSVKVDGILTTGAVTA